MGSQEIQFCLFLLSTCNELTNHHLFIKVVSLYQQKSKFQLQYFKVLPSHCQCVIGISRSSRSMQIGGKRVNNALNNGVLLLSDLFIVIH